MDLRAQLRPFAVSILAKVRFLRRTDLRADHRSRYRESIDDDIKKASTFHTHRVSVAAAKRAVRLCVDLREKNWHDQRSFDPGRVLFVAEHMVPVSALREDCMRKHSVREVVDVLMTKLTIVWVLRREDDKLTDLGFKTKRAVPRDAYREAEIDLLPPSRKKSGGRHRTD